MGSILTKEISRLQRELKYQQIACEMWKKKYEMELAKNERLEKQLESYSIL
jgi:hypothetical protein